MRDIKRIRKFCNRLAVVWEKVPDWRFGQLMSNMLGEYVAQTHRDIFFPEDDELITFFERFMNINPSKEEQDGNEASDLR